MAPNDSYGIAVFHLPSPQPVNGYWLGHAMLLRVLRALDFVKCRPEWDGKRLVVRSGSLGGIQTIAAAALDREVTVAVVSVPAACEYNGYKQGGAHPPSTAARN